MAGARGEPWLQSRPILVSGDDRLVAELATIHAIADGCVVFVLQNGSELHNRSTFEQRQRQWRQQSRRSGGLRRKLHIEFNGVDGRLSVCR